MQDFLIIAMLIPTYLESIGIMYYSIATRLFSSLLRSEPSGLEQIIFHKKKFAIAPFLSILLFKVNCLDCETYLP